MRFIIVLILVLVWAAPAGAYTGNDLYRMCGHDPTDATDEQMAELFGCVGYMRGASDVLVGFGFFCWPPGFNYQQALDVINQWLTVHPERRHEGGAIIIWAALAEAFPCPQQ